VAHEVFLLLKQSNRPPPFLAQDEVVQPLFAGAQAVWGPQEEPQAGLFLPIRQSKIPFLGWETQPLGAQLTGAAQAGLHTGAHTGRGAQVLAQSFFLHLKQSNRPFLGWETQPPGAQLTGAAQAGLQTGPGAHVVAQSFFLHLKQSNKPFLG
jgi:hypothetical protein